MSPEPTPLETNVLLSGLIVGESPRWHGGRLWFCHWRAHEIVAVDVEGRSEVVMRDEAVSPHSIEWLHDGRMLIVPTTKDPTRRLLRQEPDGTLVPHADLSGLPSGLNEIVVDGRGNIYVNGLAFDFMALLEGVKRDHEAGRDIPWTERPDYRPGFITLITPDGDVRQVAGDLAFPNGMTITPDNATLIVSESFTGTLTAFDIAPDGGLANRRVFADGIGPDGICNDADGAVWAQTGGPGCVRIREGGEVLDRVELELDRAPFALMLGGPGRRTLFILTAVWDAANPFGGPRTGQVLTAAAPASGVGWP